MPPLFLRVFFSWGDVSSPQNGAGRCQMHPFGREFKGFLRTFRAFVAAPAFCSALLFLGGSGIGALGSGYT